MQSLHLNGGSETGQLVQGWWLNPGTHKGGSLGRLGKGIHGRMPTLVWMPLLLNYIIFRGIGQVKCLE